MPELAPFSRFLDGTSTHEGSLRIRGLDFVDELGDGARAPLHGDIIEAGVGGCKIHGGTIGPVVHPGNYAVGLVGVDDVSWGIGDSKCEATFRVLLSRREIW